MADEIKYNDPAGGTDSSVGSQMNLYYWDRASLIEMQKEQYFSQMSDTTKMPKHYGKTIKKYVWIPVLDDRNQNDQGLDASGAQYANGNIYGSSKDVGTIAGKLPVLGESGGRVNRIGFTRIEIEASITQLGFFDEFTRDSVDFDSEEDILMHFRREMMYAANEISEDALQIDLLNAAGVIRFGGEATQDSEMTGETGAVVSEVDYDDFMRLAIDLRANRTPVKTKIITGSRLTDTRVISDGFPLYVGHEMLPTLRNMVDPFGNAAFIPVAHYAAAGTVMRGEVGTIDQFRIIVVPEMQNWTGVGAAVTDNGGYLDDGSNYNVYPLLSIGSGSFTTVGFQYDGKNNKWEVITKLPGAKIADRQNPYGKIGFTSIQWWYGTLIERAERIGLMKSVARM